MHWWSLASSWGPWGKGVLGVLTLSLAGALVAGLGLAVVHRFAARHPVFSTLELRTRLAGPVISFTVILSNWVGLGYLDELSAIRKPLAVPLALAATVAASWLALRCVRVGKRALFGYFDISSSNNLENRRIRTQLAFLEVLLVVGVLIGSSLLILNQFEWGKALGTSLLASAGVVSLVIGLGAQKTVANLLAGLQIAFTQPLRLEDAVVVENEWGWVEEITLTYVVIRIWDKRRLVLPINYFTERPFQNWTRTSAQVLGSVHLHVSHRAPFERIERELHRILEGTELWDKEAWVLQVVDSSPHCVELRALMTAKDSPTCWDLRCLVRRRLLEFLSREHPQALARVPIAVEAQQEGMWPVSKAPPLVEAHERVALRGS